MEIVKVHNNTVRLEGMSILRAWRPGVIAPLLAGGGALDEIIRVMKSSKYLIHEDIKHNLIVTIGRYLVADWSIAQNVQGLTWHAIGTGTTAPAITDTTLQTETARQIFVVKTRSFNIATFDAFYTAAQSNYNIKEAGVFGGIASVTANSGTLFSHYAQNYNNTVSQADLTFEYTLTITS